MTSAMIRNAFLAAALAGAVAAPGRAAVPAPGGPAAAAGEAQAALAVVAAADLDRLASDAAYARDMLPAIARLEAAESDADTLHWTRSVGVIAALAAGRFDEAIAVSGRLAGTDPQDPLSYAGAFIGAVRLERRALALATVERAAAAGVRPRDLARAFPREAVRYLFDYSWIDRDPGARRRLADALERLGWPGKADDPARDWVRLGAIDARLERGDVAGAAGIARQVEAPEPLLRLLSARRYDRLFAPGIDRAARVEAAYAAWEQASAERLAADPGDLSRLLDRIGFLRGAGREAEIPTLVEPLLADPQAVVRSGPEAIAIVEQAALGLMAGGRGEEALALIDATLAGGMKEHPALLGLAIAKAGALARLGREREALAFAEDLWGKHGRRATGFGRLAIAREGACAAAALGRGDEAAAWLARMAPEADENRAALTEAHLCTGDLAAAERSLIAELADPERAQQALFALQAAAAPGKDPLAARRAALLDRPAVRAAIAKAGRIVGRAAPALVARIE